MARAFAAVVLALCVPLHAEEGKPAKDPLKLPGADKPGLDFKKGLPIPRGSYGNANAGTPAAPASGQASDAISGDGKPVLAGVGVSVGAAQTARPLGEPVPGASRGATRNPPPGSPAAGEGPRASPPVRYFIAGLRPQKVAFKVSGIKEEDTLVCYEVESHPNLDRRDLNPGHCKDPKSFFEMPEENEQWSYRRGAWSGVFRYTDEEWGAAGIKTRSHFMDKASGRSVSAALIVTDESLTGVEDQGELARLRALLKERGRGGAPELPPGVLARDYIARPPHLPCPWGPPAGDSQGRCSYQGRLMVEAYPPPSPEGFQAVDVAQIPVFPGVGGSKRILHLGGGRKWAIRFKGKDVGPFVIAFGAVASPSYVAPMEMFVAVSRRPGDFRVPAGCLVTPAGLTQSYGPPHSQATIEVRWSSTATETDRVWAERGHLCVLEPDGVYFLNVAGDCSSYWDPQRAYASGWNNGCPTNLADVNGWFESTRP